MKLRYIAGALALGLSALTGSVLSQPPAAQTAAPVWLSDYGAAQKLARETGRPLFVVFRCER